MWRFYTALGIAWLILLPPLFTGGACTAEFDAEAAGVTGESTRIRTLEAGLQYWASRRQPVLQLSPDDCRRAKPRYLSHCGSGTLVVARVPVKNLVCRIYRDQEILVQLQYDEFGRLARVSTDMAPYKSLPIPFTSTTLYWAR
jgi:hypothetical protein